ncbi:MAG: RCC1 domain-containing protein, partial [Bdellovibrionota bacterium]
MRSIFLALLFVLAGCQKATPTSAFQKLVTNDPPGSLVGISEIAIANTHSCAITALGVKCWGDYEATRVPADLKNPRNLVLAEGSSCVLTEAGIRCWGWASRVNPPPADLKNPSRLAGGGLGYCAITDEGVRCWAGMTNPPAPLNNPTEIAVGESHACAIADDGVRCWGSDENGKSTPPAGLKNPRQLALGWNHSCVVTDDGVKCWGGGTRSCSAIPPVSYSGAIRSLVANRYSTCMIAGDKSYCWGSGNYEGECGQVQGKPLANPSAVAVYGGSDGRNSCTLSADGVKCEGRGEAVNVPTGLKNPRLFAAGGYQVCAHTEEGLKCWGSGRHDELDAPAFAPLKNQPISLLALGSGHNCALV